MVGSNAQGNDVGMIDLDRASLSELQQRYAELLGRAPPRWSSRAFLIGNIAWVSQASAAGFDPEAKYQTLRDALGAERSARRSKVIKPGTRLIREWQGETHEVVVEAEGYRWHDQRYRSLSRIAQEITGTKWSGPRFFGLEARSR